jgi:hypothetical protein
MAGRPRNALQGGGGRNATAFFKSGNVCLCGLKFRPEFGLRKARRCAGRKDRGAKQLRRRKTEVLPKLATPMPLFLSRNIGGRDH